MTPPSTPSTPIRTRRTEQATSYLGGMMITHSTHPHCLRGHKSRTKWTSSWRWDVSSLRSISSPQPWRILSRRRCVPTPVLPTLVWESDRPPFPPTFLSGVVEPVWTGLTSHVLPIVKVIVTRYPRLPFLRPPPSWRCLGRMLPNYIKKLPEKETKDM